MKGWTPDGTEVELTKSQVTAVHGALHGAHWPGGRQLGRAAGKSTVLTTAYRLDRGPNAGDATDLRLSKAHDYPLPARGVRQIGWIDQRGNVWEKCPPISTFRGGSLSPLLIACEEGETVVTRLHELSEEMNRYWDASRYTTGLANGVMMALGVVEGTDVCLHERPRYWAWRSVKVAWRRLKLRLNAPAVDDDGRPFPLKATGTFPLGTVTGSGAIYGDMASTGEIPYPADLVPKELPAVHRIRMAGQMSVAGHLVPFEQSWDIPARPRTLSITLPEGVTAGTVLRLAWEDSAIPESANEGDDDDRLRE